MIDDDDTFVFKNFFQVTFEFSLQTFLASSG